jgi:L-arabinose isomerase
MSANTLSAGFMPLYLKLYDDANPGSDAQFAPFVQSIESRLTDLGLSLVSPGVVFDTPHVEKAKRLFDTNDISFLVLVHLSYSPSLLVADLIEEIGIPVILIDTTPEYTFEGMREDYLMRNHGIHGVMDLTSVLTSRNVDFSVVGGHPDDGTFVGKLERVVASFKAAALMKNQKIGITGSPFSGMGDFAIEFASLEKQFGTTVRDVTVEEIVEESKSISDEAVKRQVEEDGRLWDLSSVSPEAHARAVRDYLAIEEIVDKESLTAYTMNFQHIGDTMATPFYACSRLMSRGIGYGGEGDVLTATLGRPLNMLSSAAKFDEFFCADWKNNRILMSHMGESDSRFIKQGSSPRLVERDALLNPHTCAIYRFQAEPGEVTFVNLSPVREGEYRLVAGLLDIVDAPTLDDIQGPHYQVATRLPVGDFLEQYAANGGGHHLYVAKGDILYDLSIFCNSLGFDFRTI